MMDLEETEPLSKKEEERGCESNNETKSCKDCKTTKTPLWRSGPAGPKSLCNACGIRYRKKRSSMVGLDLDGKIPSSTKKKEKAHLTSSGGMGGRESLKMRFLVWGKEVILQRAPPAALSLSSLSSLGVVKKQRCQRRRKLKEEEMAAFSLMALSCGSVFA